MAPEPRTDWRSDPNVHSTLDMLHSYTPKVRVGVRVMLITLTADRSMNCVRDDYRTSSLVDYGLGLAKLA